MIYYELFQKFADFENTLQIAYTIKDNLTILEILIQIIAVTRFNLTMLNKQYFYLLHIKYKIIKRFIFINSF